MGQPITSLLPFRWGAEDELVCPTEHVEFLKAKLRDADGVHLLVIGYSGYDREVIRVLKEPAP
jgi:hypothetical protein